MIRSAVKFLAASAACAAMGLAATSVSSGQSIEGEIVVASLQILPGETVYSDFGSQRAMTYEESAAAERSAVAVPTVAAEERVQKDDQFASLDESEAYAQYLALNRLSSVPVPTPRPRAVAQASRLTPVAQKPRVAQARPVAQPVRVAQNDVRKRVLRASPVMIGVYR